MNKYKNLLSVIEAGITVCDETDDTQPYLNILVTKDLFNKLKSELLECIIKANRYSKTEHYHVNGVDESNTTHDIYDIKIEDAFKNASTRLRNILKNNGMYTVGDIIKFNNSKYTWVSLKNFGRKSYMELRTIMKYIYSIEIKVPGLGEFVSECNYPIMNLLKEEEENNEHK